MTATHVFRGLEGGSGSDQNEWGIRLPFIEFPRVVDRGSESDLTDFKLFARTLEAVLCSAPRIKVNENCHVLGGRRVSALRVSRIVGGCKQSEGGQDL
jgi:hypothetical protein